MIGGRVGLFPSFSMAKISSGRELPKCSANSAAIACQGLALHTQTRWSFKGQKHSTSLKKFSLLLNTLTYCQILPFHGELLK